MSTTGRDMGLIGDTSVQIHEIKPVKFSGSPTAQSNKVLLTSDVHSKVTTWWNNLQVWLTEHF